MIVPAQAYRFITDLAAHYPDPDVAQKIGRVIKRIYRNFDHLYLIETHEGTLCALSASRFERTVFTDLVAINYTDNKIFLQDSRKVQVRVRNFKLTEETMQNYLDMPGKILYEPKKPPESPPENLVWNIIKQEFEHKYM